MKKTLLTLIVCLLAAIPAAAQNKIDRLVEKYSTVGSSQFTSVVKRNPQTRQVEKVVKVLKINQGKVKELREAFMEESSTGTFREKKEDGQTTLLLTVETPQAVRIYMLEYGSHPGLTQTKTTIIVKMTSQKE